MNIAEGRIAPGNSAGPVAVTAISTGNIAAATTPDNAAR
jgi:hypothetical protein